MKEEVTTAEFESPVVELKLKESSSASRFLMIRLYFDSLEFVTRGSEVVVVISEESFPFKRLFFTSIVFFVLLAHDRSAPELSSSHSNSYTHTRLHGRTEISLSSLIRLVVQTTKIKEVISQFFRMLT